MIVDASAVLAVLLEEPEGRQIEDIIVRTVDELVMSPMNFLEAAVRVDRLKSEAKSETFDRFMQSAGITLVPITEDQAFRARQAYKTYGKGNHPAKLNLGDCFAYALSKARGEPLLFKGDDFRLTDVEAVI
ncbi:MAG: type II toxin-antitoxin system VapC family toxin [Mesorhizobium sp.]|nr:type II toxin-antitoxin system VapC family toxin [Mesorhizobium sp.]MCO5160842.1 type II toxin-antitoxin system VapC family toxin [Mesorhizobium sp.]